MIEINHTPSSILESCVLVLVALEWEKCVVCVCHVSKLTLLVALILVCDDNVTDLSSCRVRVEWYTDYTFSLELFYMDALVTLCNQLPHVCVNLILFAWYFFLCGWVCFYFCSKTVTLTVNVPSDLIVWLDLLLLL